MQRSEIIAADRINCAHNKHGYYNFFLLAWNKIEKVPLSNGFHIQYICDRLQKEVERIVEGRPKEKDLIINIPPRSSKSSLCSVFLNAWAWTLYPHLHFISVSYSGGLSETHSIKCKNLMESVWYQERWGDVWSYSAKKNTNTKFFNNKGGMRFSTSVTGTITGEGGDIITCDDLLNPLQSQSKAERLKANRFFTETLSSRLNQPDIGLYLMVQQRTHMEDVVGTELAERPNEYDRIIIPATDEYPIHPPGLAKYYKGGLFEPKRFSRKVLKKLEAKMADYAGQYGQNPVKPDGNLVKKFMLPIVPSWKVPPEALNQVRDFVVDGSDKEKANNDPTGILSYTFYKNYMFIFGYGSLRARFGKRVDFIRNYVMNNGSPESRVWFEPKSSGTAMYQYFQDFSAINAREWPMPKGDKIQKLSNVLPFLESQRIIIVDFPGAKPFRMQCMAFPNAKHDEEIDTLVMAAYNCFKRGFSQGYGLRNL